MKVPGKAWLQFEARPERDDGSLFIQTAYFDPKGLSGLIYWYVLYPIHALIFSGMVDKISRYAEAASRRRSHYEQLESC